MPDDFTPASCQNTPEMHIQYLDYEIDDSIARVQFDQVRQWLSTTYWARPQDVDAIEYSSRNSALVVAAYSAAGQAGFLRVISDRSTFGYLCDVFVAPAHRGRGIARAMVRFALEHPDFQGLRRWMLATADAHGVYAALGFSPLETPDRWMMLRPNAGSEAPDCV
jgi:GNAT superfamily N-acetyltransferase